MLQKQTFKVNDVNTVLHKMWAKKVFTCFVDGSLQVMYEHHVHDDVMQIIEEDANPQKETPAPSAPADPDPAPPAE